jgi:hypothetical protein
MVKVLFGEKGMGKTKQLVDKANNFCRESSGNVVFIDDSDDLMYDLDREIRFINISEYPIKEENGLLGFICGIISEDYDIEGVFIDGTTYLLISGKETLEELLKNLHSVSEKFGVEFHISIHGDSKETPGFIREFM